MQIPIFKKWPALKEKTFLNEIFLSYPPESLSGLSPNNSIKHPNTHLLTFGGGAENYRLSVSRLESVASMTGWFDEIHALTDNSTHEAIDKLFSDHGEFIKANYNVFGYWIWKPFLIDYFLNKIPDQEILFYMDPGCEISSFGSDRFYEFVDFIDRHETLFFSYPRDGIELTKRIAYDYLEGERFSNPRQIQATWFGLKNSPKVRGLIKEWLRLSCYKNYRLLDYDSYGVEEYPEFEKHVSDQAILNILVRRNGFMAKPYEDLFKGYLYHANSWVLLEPIHAMRNRGGDSRLTKLVESSSVDKCIKDLKIARGHFFYPIKLIFPCLRWFFLRVLSKLGLLRYP